MPENARERLWLFTIPKKSRTRRFTVTVPEEMANRLEDEREKRLLGNISGKVRKMLSEYPCHSNMHQVEDCESIESPNKLIHISAIGDDFALDHDQI